MKRHHQHWGLLIAGVVLQAIAGFDVPWVAPYRAGFLAVAGTLLTLASTNEIRRKRGEEVTVPNGRQP